MGIVSGHDRVYEREVEAEAAKNVERRASNDRSKHFHGEKEVDKEETCEKEGGNNEEKARLHGRASTAGCWFSGSVNAVASHRQCTIEIARCIYKWHPFRKGKRGVETHAGRNVSIDRRNRVAHTCGSRVERGRLSSTDRSNRRAFFLFFPLSLFFSSFFAFSISIPDNRYYIWPIDRK